jgi:hypothetical protein
LTRDQASALIFGNVTAHIRILVDFSVESYADLVLLFIYIAASLLSQPTALSIAGNMCTGLACASITRIFY